MPAGIMLVVALLLVAVTFWMHSTATLRELRRLRVVAYVITALILVQLMYNFLLHINGESTSDVTVLAYAILIAMTPTCYLIDKVRILEEEPRLRARNRAAP